MNKIKIGIVINSVYTTGAFNSILFNCIELKNNFDFVFIIPSKSNVNEILEKRGFKYYRLPYREINRNLSNNLSYTFTLIKNGYLLSKIIKQEKIRIIHVNDLFNLAPIVSKLFSRFKLITHVRRLENSFPKYLFLTWVSIQKIFSDSIICVSKTCARPFEVNSKTEVILDCLPQSEKYERYHVNMDTGKFKILYLANYNLGKGQNLAIEAINNLVQDGVKNFSVSFIGGDFGNIQNFNYKNSLQHSIKQYKLEEYTELKDAVTDVEEVMKKYDIILNFSESESFSMVCAEALFYGVPLISSNCGGPAELIEHNTTGLLIENKNVNEMTKAISILLNSPELRQKFSENSHRMIREKYIVTNPFEQLSKIYKTFGS